MRIAILISIAAFLLIPDRLHADDDIAQIQMDSGTGYIISEKYATDHRAQLLANIPTETKITGFWTPLEPDITVAERKLHELVQRGAREPELIFPDLAKENDATSRHSLEQEKSELELVSQNFDAYKVRQYVGIIIQDRKIVFCNYSETTKGDPATEYIFPDKYFAPGDEVHFLQARFDAVWKTCSNVSLIGSWEPKTK